jgi:hypothetical protein
LANITLSLLYEGVHRCSHQVIGDALPLHDVSHALSDCVVSASGDIIIHDDDEGGRHQLQHSARRSVDAGATDSEDEEFAPPRSENSSISNSSTSGSSDSSSDEKALALELVFYGMHGHGVVAGRVVWLLCDWQGHVESLMLRHAISFHQLQ